MSVVKKQMDEEYTRDKKKEKNKGNGNDSGKGKGKGKWKGKGKKRRREENDDDEKQGTCHMHPKGKHAWKDCFLNPNNPNNRLDDPKFNPELRDRGRGKGRDGPRSARGNGGGSFYHQAQRNGAYYHHDDHGHHPQSYGPRSHGQDGYYGGGSSRQGGSTRGPPGLPIPPPTHSQTFYRDEYGDYHPM